MKNDYSIAHDHPKREIRKPARYIDSEELVAYTFIAAGEIVVKKIHASENPVTGNTILASNARSCTLSHSELFCTRCCLWFFSTSVFT